MLTVTDNKGAKATASTQVVVTGNPAKVLRVTSISLTSAVVSGRKVVKATVKVTDLNGSGRERSHRERSLERSDHGDDLEIDHHRRYGRVHLERVSPRVEW